MNGIYWVGAAAIVAAVILPICWRLHRSKKLAAKRRAVPFVQRSPSCTHYSRSCTSPLMKAVPSHFCFTERCWGVIRQNDFLCYDFDVVTGIMDDELECLLSHLRFNIKKYPCYSLTVRPALGNEFVITHNQTEIHADVLAFKRQTSFVTRRAYKLYSQATYPPERIFPLRAASFRGSVYISNRPRKLLELYYGQRRQRRSTRVMRV